LKHPHRELVEQIKTEAVRALLPCLLKTRYNLYLGVWVVKETKQIKLSFFNLSLPYSQELLQFCSSFQLEGYECSATRPIAVSDRVLLELPPFSSYTAYMRWEEQQAAKIKAMREEDEGEQRQSSSTD